MKSNGDEEEGPGPVSCLASQGLTLYSRTVTIGLGCSLGMLGRKIQPFACSGEIALSALLAGKSLCQ